MHPEKEGEKNILRCLKCEEILEGEISTKEKMPKKVEKGKGVTDDKNIFATYELKCEKCGYGKAEIRMRQAVYSDEDSVIIAVCGKCGHGKHLERKSA